MCHDARVGRHTIRAVREAQIPFGGTARSAHPGVLIAVLAAAGISVSLMQTLIIPLVPELPKLLDTSPTNASWAITVTLLTAAVATPGVRPARRHVRPQADPDHLCGDADRRFDDLGADEFAGAVHRRPRPAGAGYADHPAGDQRAARGGPGRPGRFGDGIDQRVTGRRRRAGPATVGVHRREVRLAHAVLVRGRPRLRRRHRRRPTGRPPRTTCASWSSH